MLIYSKCAGLLKSQPNKASICSRQIQCYLALRADLPYALVRVRLVHGYEVVLKETSAPSTVGTVVLYGRVGTKVSATTVQVSVTARDSTCHSFAASWFWRVPSELPSFAVVASVHSDDAASTKEATRERKFGRTAAEIRGVSIGEAAASTYYSSPIRRWSPVVSQQMQSAHCKCFSVSIGNLGKPECPINFNVDG